MRAQTNRRALIGALALAPIAAASAIPAAKAPATEDPRWRGLVADFRGKYTAWLATIDLEEDAEDAFRIACASLPPEPIKPAGAAGSDILDKTLRELRDESDAPAHKTAWAAYKRDHAAWKAERESLREQHVGPAKAEYDRAFAVRSDAFNALTTYRVTNLRDLREKVEIVVGDYEGSDIPPEYMTDILDDVRNLAGRMEA